METLLFSPCLSTDRIKIPCSNGQIKSAGIKQIGDILDYTLFSCDEATLTAAMERTGQLFRKLSKSGKGVGWIADSELDPNSERGESKITAIMKWPYW